MLEVDEEKEALALQQAEEALQQAKEDMAEEIVTPVIDEVHEEVEKELDEKIEEFVQTTPVVNPLDDLRFIRLLDPIHIPTYLVENLTSRKFPVEKFYDYMKVICSFQTPNGNYLNNTVFLYALLNDKLKQVKGFLFLTLDILSNDLYINQFSIDDDYWFKGEALRLVKEHALQLKKDVKANRILWLSKNKKLLRSFGFKASYDTLMSIGD